MHACKVYRFCAITTLMICCLIAFSQGTLREPLQSKFNYKTLSSGPIFLIDKRTILVTHFTYFSNRLKNVWNPFNKWFRGVITVGPKKFQYVDLEFDNGTIAQLTQYKYYGLNVYLRVIPTSEYSVADFTSIAIMNEKNETKTSVNIRREDIEDLPEHNSDHMYQDGKFVFIYPKCCPLNRYMFMAECIPITNEEIPEQRFPVHEVINNGTLMYFNEPITDIIYEPYVELPKCVYALFEASENVALLANGEFVSMEGDDRETVLACMDFYKEAENNPLMEVVFTCVTGWQKDVQRAGHGNAPISGPCITMLFCITLLFVILVK